MNIRTPRLLLRALELADASRISLLAGDYDVASMTGTIPASLWRGAGCGMDRKRARRRGGCCLRYRQWGLADRLHRLSRLRRGPRRARLLDRQALLGHGLCERGGPRAHRPCLRERRLRLSHRRPFHRQPASARIIAKFGFVPQGRQVRDCAARGVKAHCLTYRLERAAALAGFLRT